MSQIKNILCTTKGCKKVVAKTDGVRIIPLHRLPSNLLSHKKKRQKPLYCIYCHKITRAHKIKFNSSKNKKTGNKLTSK